jgi:murein DD-endopeptidase MepM/ murein hydrolase activator NlpD
MGQKPQQKLLARLKNKYHLKIYNETTYEEVLSLRLSRLNVFIVVGIMGTLLITATTILISFTPLREFIPGYPDGNMRRDIIRNALSLDSLEYEIKVRDQYFQALKSVMEGKTPANRIGKQDTLSHGSIHFSKSKEDSLFRLNVEKEEEYNISFEDEAGKTNPLKRLHFFPPVRGLVTSKFDVSTGHFGTDVVSSPNQVVSSVLDGTVISASWSVETGYTIQVQHQDDLISVYKHNSQMLKKAGDRVTAGDPIAITGNTGELSSGPHLHFELWQRGLPIDAESFIRF